MSKIIYLSHFISETTPAYGGAKDRIKIEQARSTRLGDSTNELYLHFPNHISTHIDFPKHFDVNGKTASDYPADFWHFDRVGFVACDMANLETAIAHLPTDIELLLVKTGFENERGNEAYWAAQPVVAARYAEILRGRFKQLRVLGFDLISLTSKLDRNEGRAAHIAFLCEHDILVLEDMHLTALNKTPKKVIIAPLQIREADGVLCTVLAYL